MSCGEECLIENIDWLDIEHAKLAMYFLEQGIEEELKHDDIVEELAYVYGISFESAQLVMNCFFMRTFGECAPEDEQEVEVTLSSN